MDEIASAIGVAGQDEEAVAFFLRCKRSCKVSKWPLSNRPGHLPGRE